MNQYTQTNSCDCISVFQTGNPSSLATLTLLKTSANKGVRQRNIKPEDDTVSAELGSE